MSKKKGSHYPVIIEQDKDGFFIVNCPTLTGCRSYGRTFSEAMDNIKEAIAVCVEDSAPTPEDSPEFIGVRDVELAT